MEDYLCHKKKHKYIKKIGNRYFYSIDELKAYMDKSKASREDHRVSSSPKSILDISSNKILTGKNYVSGKSFTVPISKVRKLSDVAVDTANSKAKKFFSPKLNKVNVSRITSKYDKLSDHPEISSEIPKKKEKSSKEDDMKSVNEKYYKEPPDQNYRQNCADCSLAYDMRRRGYDVEAIPNDRGTNMETILSWYDVKEVTSVKRNMLLTSFSFTDNEQRAIEKDIVKKQGNGARGIMTVQWTLGGGHAVAYEVENGKVYIYDAQPGRKTELSHVLSRARKANYFRTDNASPTTEAVKYVNKRKK